MAVGAGTLITIAAISALASGGGVAAGGYFAGKAAEDQAKKQEKLTRDKMAQDDRHHRDALRARKKEFDFSKIGAGMNTLSGLANLKQNIGKPTASQKLLA